MSYSIDFRRKVVEIYEKNKSLRKTADMLCVSYKFVQDIVKRAKAGESIAPRPHGGGKQKKIQEVHIPFLMELIENENDLRLEDICQRLYEKFSLKIDVSTLCETFGRLGVSRKKNFPRPGCGQERKCIKNNKLSRKPFRVG